MTPIRIIPFIIFVLVGGLILGGFGLLVGSLIGLGFIACMNTLDQEREKKRRRAQKRTSKQSLEILPPPPSWEAGTINSDDFPPRDLSESNIVFSPTVPASAWKSPPTLPQSTFGTTDYNTRQGRRSVNLTPAASESVQSSTTNSIISPPRVVQQVCLDEVVTATRPSIAKKLEWVGPGDSLQIAGRTIPGMVYVSDVSLGWKSEPSAILRPLDVVKGATWMEDLPYFPCYETLNSNQRAIYLDWLARGRRDDDPNSLPSGYLFLFFYGIERRVLWDGDRNLALWDEVFDLLHTYGLNRKSWSVASYFGDFLHYTAYAMGPERYSEVCPALLEAQGKRLSETGRAFALANSFRMGHSVDWNLAHVVAMNLEESRRSVVTERTGDAFKSMFRKRFEEAYPAGLILKASKRNQRVHYRGGNNTLSDGPRTSAPRSEGIWPPGFVIDVPGVMGIPSQFKKLSSIWNQCIEDLSGYSRAITRLTSAASVSNQDRMTAYLALPPEIRKEHCHPLADQLNPVLQACPEIDGIRFMPVSVLAALLGIEERPNLTLTQSTDIAELLESLGFTLAPHPKLLNFPLSWSQEIGVVQCTSTSSSEASLGGLLRLLLLAVLVASADGEVDENELEVFHCASGVNDEFTRIQIAATEAALLRDTRVATRQLPRIAKSVPKIERKGVFKLLVHIAGCDDVISSDENRLLRKIAKVFELGDNALDDILTEDSAFQTVTVARGQTRTQGEAIPTRPAGIPSHVFSLDMERIAALTKETSEVVSILSKALAEEDHGETLDAPSSDTALGAALTSFPKWANSLDPRYQPALMELLSLPNNVLIDLAAVAKKHHLMKDDLLDGINAWSDEFLEDFLIEETANDKVSLRRDLIPLS